ncbi:MAG: tRNA guanosine(15) transglycosylase TgtA [Candidatus Aenigmatarchaeota archaeon]
MLELIDRDAGGRISRWEIGKHKITLPNICIVINPNRMLIKPRDMKKYGAEIIITNSYIIQKHENLRKQAVKGIHRFLGWDGPVYTDSGTFQMYSQKVKGIDPEKIIEFQNAINSDIETPVDVFTLPDDTKAVAKKKLNETTRRVKQARKSVVNHLAGPIQGGMSLDLRADASRKIAKINPDVFAIGGIVPLMEQYMFKELCDIALTCKKNLPAHRPLHAFGAGHPITFAILTAFGCDLFDSAIYHIAARRGGYLTINGTYHLDDLREFPCSCPVCAHSTPDKLKQMKKEKQEEFLTKHNLHITFSELRTVRQAIRENWLWELVQIRARAHPSLLEALMFCLKKYGNYLEKLDPITKKSAFFYSGEESKYRPEVRRARAWLKRVKSRRTFIKEPFGKVPLPLLGVYPFGQSLVPGFKEPKGKVKPKEIIAATVQYQYGSKLRLKKPRIEVSKRTGRIRRIWKGKTLVGTIRSYDGLFLPTREGAKLVKMKKVFVEDKEVAEYIKKGKSMFAKFISKADDIIPGEEVAVYRSKELLAVGRALLNKNEVKEMERGIAVKTRAT